VRDISAGPGAAIRCGRGAGGRTQPVLEVLKMSDEERRERGAVSGGWREVRTLEDVEGQGRLVDRHAGRNPGMVDRSDAAIAREMLKITRRSVEWHGGP
jgi:hypothetical protein